MNHPGPQDGSGIDEGKVAAIVVGPMLGTNILSTSLIAWKAWCVLILNPFCYHSLLTAFPKGIPQNRQRTPKEGQSVRSRRKSTCAPNRVGFRVLCLMGKPISHPRGHWSNFSHHKQCVRQIFYLLTAFRVLPGSGSYTVNLVMLFLSVRRPAVERSSRIIDVTGVSKSMYPAIIIIIACTQIGQEGYNTRLDATGGSMDLTTIRFSAGDHTVDFSLPTTTTSDGGKPFTEIPNQRQ